ncbi:MAG: pentapeptide repeat-containing protein [Bacteroidota bacterium]
MSMPYFSDVIYQGLAELEPGKYEYCAFQACDFKQLDLSEIAFWECTFDECDLSNADIRDADFRDVAFRSCKLLGIDFSTTKDFLFSVYFEKCQLDYANFTGKQMPHTPFTDCSLKEADFTQASLSQATFSNCELHRTIFEQTNLEKADFRTASNFIIDPENNILKKARFSGTNLSGLLKKYNLDIE